MLVFWIEKNNNMVDSIVTGRYLSQHLQKIIWPPVNIAIHLTALQHRVIILPTPFGFSVICARTDQNMMLLKVV